MLFIQAKAAICDVVSCGEEVTSEYFEEGILLQQMKSSIGAVCTLFILVL